MAFMIRHSDLTSTYQGNDPIPLNGKRTGNDMEGYSLADL